MARLLSVLLLVALVVVPAVGQTKKKKDEPAPAADPRTIDQTAQTAHKAPEAEKAKVG